MTQEGGQELVVIVGGNSNSALEDGDRRKQCQTSGAVRCRKGAIGDPAEGPCSTPSPASPQGMHWTGGGGALCAPPPGHPTYT